MYLILYVLALAAVAVHAPAVVWQPGAREFVIILGTLGAWRYGWGAVHLVRALLYRRLVFPRWRRRADQLAAEAPAAHVYIVITSFRIPAETTARVYQAAIAEAIRHGGPATIVAGIVELGDQRLIKRLFQQMAPPADVGLMFVRRPGTGKRHSMATALRAISRTRPPADAAVVVVDGDTLLTPGTLARSLPFLQLMPDVDGITTDERAIVDGGLLMRAWHGLRFAQRHQLMSSMGLSGRLLAMTGRMSVFRAAVATETSFIEAVEHDVMNHWRFGRIPLLTGEDKSTWFWLLAAGRRMLYLPDVQVVTVEHPLSRWFLPATTDLMLRWFGNMLRGSTRAIALGPRRIGWFTWWCLIDQRWTRQNIRGAVHLAPWRARLVAVQSAYLHLLALSMLATAVALATNILPWPRPTAVALLF